MPSCSACGTDMVIHEEGLFQNVWKCPDNSHHPTQTRKSGFAWGIAAVGAGGALLIGGPALAATVIASTVGGGNSG